MKKPGESQCDAAPSSDRKALLNEALRQRIGNMELAPGAIVDELALSEEFGLSRPPVRELMRQLAAEGYLELEPNRPARVSPMSYQSLRSFFVAAPLIYAATTQLAATNATADDIAALKQTQHHFRTAIAENDARKRVFYNDQFHLEIGQMARNAYLLPSLRRLLLDHSRLGMTFYQDPVTEEMRQSFDTAVVQHDQIIDAIEQRDVERAGALVRAHFDLSRRRMADYVTPEGLDVPLF
ncbi:MAG: GntR family transcriptional regulator [Acetobacter sp.]|uniref:GntR family transcriptional regulator n=1 Tax=Acetobacter sp. TaxID=440 RepID=UPI0039EBE1A7